jgi:Serine/threonine protein kinase
LSQDESEDEGADFYRKGGYHPVAVGDTYKDGRYVVREKLGWGHFSTVWICDDVQHPGTRVALKVQKSASHYTEAARDEITILDKIARVNEVDDGERPPPHGRKGKTGERKDAERRAAAGDTRGETADGGAANRNRPPPPPHPGSSKVVRLVDSFEHKGPNGTHVCMCFEVLGDNLLALIKRYDYRGIPMRAVKAICRDVLMGLDYLHSRKKIIHTDLKPENVLLRKPLPKPEPETEPVPETETARDMDVDGDGAFGEARVYGGGASGTGSG